MHLVAPQWLACSDVIRYLRDKKRLANLRRSREKVRARVQQTIYNRRPALPTPPFWLAMAIICVFNDFTSFLIGVVMCLHSSPGNDKSRHLNK